jgi:Na+/phosphate symporter
MDIVALIKEVVTIINDVAPIIEGEFIKTDADKAKAIEYLTTQIDKIKNDIAKEKITILHAKLGQGLLKDEAKLIGYNLELDGLEWCLKQVTEFQIPTEPTQDAASTSQVN